MVTRNAPSRPARGVHSMAADPGVVAAGAVATVVTFSAFGITETEFILGAIAMLFGTLARTGFAVQATLEADGKVSLAKTIGALAAACLTAPFLSALAFSLAKVMNFESDATICVLLLAAGYGGPQVVKKFMDLVTSMVTSRLAPKDQGK